MNDQDRAKMAALEATVLKQAEIIKELGQGKVDPYPTVVVEYGAPVAVPSTEDDDENLEEFAQLHRYHQQGLLTVLPDYRTGWDEVELPVWFIFTEGMETDIYRNAQRAAQNTGSPQRIIHPGGNEKVILPDWDVRRAVMSGGAAG